MQLTVIFADRTIQKDGVVHHAVDVEDWSLTQGNMHAIQWHDTAGHIEFTDGSTGNQKLSNESQVSVYSAFFDALTAAYASREASLNSIDTRHYTVGDLNRTTNTYTAIAKSLATIQAEQVSITKNNANRLLAQTDWYVSRNQELGTAIPSDVSTYRSEVRSACNTTCAALLAASDFNAVIAVAEAAFPAPLDPDTYYQAG